MNLLQIIAVTILTVASSAQADGESHPQTGQLTNAIVSMQEQEYDKFVIVEIPETDNYFQFGAEGASAYFFDVPTMSLTPEQKQRAEAFFAARGIEVTSVDATNPQTMESFTLESYQKLYKRNDAAGGASMGVGFMIEVLQYTDEVRIISGWQ